MQKEQSKQDVIETKKTSNDDYVTLDFRGLSMPWAIMISAFVFTVGISLSLYFGLSARSAATTPTGTDNDITVTPTPKVFAQSDFDTVASALANYPFKGSKDAKVIVVEFGDYSCSFCGSFFSSTEPLLFKDYVNNGKVAFYYVDYPRNSSVADSQYYSICIAKEYGNEKFFAYHDEMYKNLASYYATADFDTAKVKSFLSANGMDFEKIKTCAAATAPKDQLARNGELLNLLGQASTPMFFVAKSNNGKLTEGTMIEGAQPYSVFQQVLNAYLK